MEDLKRLFRKGGFLLILLCLTVATGSFFTGFKEDKGRKQPEESQESLLSPYFLEEPDSRPILIRSGISLGNRGTG